jgi:PHD/YefM family antitoxin component YafN of YafNO toxin-antitoxin module
VAEQLKSITDARKSLRAISGAAQSRMDRYIITNQGQPQSVLIGYREYQSLKATQELMSRPEERARLERGLEQLSQGRRRTFDELKRNVQRRRPIHVEVDPAELESDA